MKFSSLCLLLTSALALELHAATPQAIFTGLGDLPGGLINSTASGISSDGSQVVGTSTSANGSEAYYWSEGSGMVGIGDFPGGPFNSQARASSANGTYVVGSGTSGIGVTPVTTASRWNQATGLTSLGSLNPAGYKFSFATGISADGSMVVGDSLSPVGFRAFLWTASSPTLGSMASLGTLIPTPILTGDRYGLTSGAAAITPSGSHVVGRSGYSVSTIEIVDPPPYTYEKRDPVTGALVLDENGNIIYLTTDPDPYEVATVIEQGSEAFIWTPGFGPGTGIVGLGDLPGGPLGSEALAVSSDGSIVVGLGQSEEGQEAVVWTDGVLESVGDLDGGFVSSRLNDLTADGSIAVGEGTTAAGSAAMVWSEELGIGDLNTLLAGQGLDLGGWVLTSATGISDDGQIIVGNGINPAGDPEAWRITDALTLLNILIPPPDGLQESMRIVRGEAAQFTAERGRSYQLLESLDLSTWTPEGNSIDTSNAGESFVHALPISPATGSSFYLLGPSLIPSEADTLVSMIEGTLLQYTSERGYIYQPEFSDDLITWTPFGGAVDTSSDAGPVDRVFIDTSIPPTHPQRFYRLQTALSGILTVPFDLYVGYSLSVLATLGQDYQIQRSEELHPSGFPWINHVDYGPLITASGSAQDVLWHVAIPPINFGQEGYQIVSVPELEVQPLNPASYGAVISFTAQPDTTYQVQLTTDDINFTNVGSAINTIGNTSALVRGVLDAFSPSSPPANVSYRVLETAAP